MAKRRYRTKKRNKRNKQRTHLTKKRRTTKRRTKSKRMKGGMEWLKRMGRGAPAPDDANDETFTGVSRDWVETPISEDDEVVEAAAEEEAKHDWDLETMNEEAADLKKTISDCMRKISYLKEPSHASRTGSLTVDARRELINKEMEDAKSKLGALNEKIIKVQGEHTEEHTEECSIM